MSTSMNMKKLYHAIFRGPRLPHPLRFAAETKNRCGFWRSGRSQSADSSSRCFTKRWIAMSRGTQNRVKSFRGFFAMPRSYFSQKSTAARSPAKAKWRRPLRGTHRSSAPLYPLTDDLTYPSFQAQRSIASCAHVVAVSV